VRTLTVRTERRSQLIDVTAEVLAAIAGEAGSAVVVYVPHTTAGVIINEHADPAVARDHEAALERVVDDGWPWQHHEPGEENAPTHIRASLMGPSVVVPLLDDGSLALGTWQGIFLCEFDGPRQRRLHVSVLA
jgi:secondary thiamine-phosphate synthase enzyme